MEDFVPTLVDLVDVPMRQRQASRIWKKRFDEIPEGKAIMIRYNNRQRAHQVRTLIHTSARYWKASIFTRIIHAEPAIHGTDGWLVYFWKREDEA